MPSVCEMEPFNFLHKRKSLKSRQRSEVWSGELRSHISEIYTNIRLCWSALLCLSCHMTADFSLISILKELMKVLCHACWLAVYSWSDLFVQSEENMEDLHHHTWDVLTVFSRWKEPYQIPGQARHHLLFPPRARERALQGWCDKINLAVTALPPFPAAGGLNLLV